MKSIKTETLLDPLWMVRSKNIDLEYYEFILMATKQSFDKAIEKGYSSLQEIIFHYLNLNHLIDDGLVFDSALNKIEDGNAPTFFNGFKNKQEDLLDILRVADKYLTDIMIVYLKKALDDLSKFNFYFNSTKVHRKDRVYVVFKYVNDDQYEIWKLDYNPKCALGFEFKKQISATFVETSPNLFKQNVVGLNASLSDFEPSQNVLVVVCNSQDISKTNALTLAKDMIIANKAINTESSFDSNAILDLLTVVEKRKGSELTVQPRI